MRRSIFVLTLLLLPFATKAPFASTGPTTPTCSLARGSYGTAATPFNDASGVATDRDGNVFAADAGNSRIPKFDRYGNFLAIWGGFGSGNGQFNGPHGVAVDAAGIVSVADSDNNRVRKFSGTGAYLGGSGSSGGGAGIDLAGWDQLGTFSAYGESEYSIVLPSRVVATSTSFEYSACMVRAATPSPFFYFDSGAENGLSIDNLARLGSRGSTSALEPVRFRD